MSKKRVGIVALVVTALGGLTSCFVSVSDLGGERAVAYGINASGVIVGQSDLPTSSPSINDSHTFKRLTDDSVVDLGTLPGHVWSEALDINDSGTIVGNSGISQPGTYVTSAVTWNPAGQIAALPAAGWGTTRAEDINASGVVVGSGGLGGVNRAFFYKPSVGSLTALALLPGATTSFATGLNDNGIVVGQVGFPNGTSKLVRWNVNDYGVADITALTGLNGVKDINNAGVIIGTMEPEHPEYQRSRAGVWFPGTTSATPITNIPSFAEAIDESGTVVGRDYNGVEFFRWSPAGGYEYGGSDAGAAVYDIGPGGAIVGQADGQPLIWYPDL